MAKTHPHIESPSEDQLRSVMESKATPMQELYLAMHGLVVDTLPDVRYSVDLNDGEIGYGAYQYGYDGWGMAAVAPYTKWVSLALLRGTAVEDPTGLLQGTGSTIRHVKVRSIDEFAEIRDELSALIEAAARLNQG